MFRAFIVYVLHRVGAKRCSKDVKGCNAFCKHDGDDDGKPPLLELAKEPRVKKGGAIWFRNITIVVNPKNYTLLVTLF